jgi:hypothetical protein
VECLVQYSMVYSQRSISPPSLVPLPVGHRRRETLMPDGWIPIEIVMQASGPVPKDVCPCLMLTTWPCRSMGKNCLGTSILLTWRRNAKSSKKNEEITKTILIQRQDPISRGHKSFPDSNVVFMPILESKQGYAKNSKMPCRDSLPTPLTRRSW